MAFPDGWLHIRNWEKYQSIQHGHSAPWVRVYQNLIYDPEFTSLPAAQRFAFIALLTFAGSSQHVGSVPDDCRMLARRMSLGRHKLAIDLMISKGLIEKNSGPEERRVEESRGDKPPIVPQPQKPAAPYSAEFDSFWTSYPKKVGKEAAWKAWQKAKINGEAGAVVASVKEHTTWEQWKDPRFIPHPATFLNQHRWLDEKPKSKYAYLDEE